MRRLLGAGWEYKCDVTLRARFTYAGSMLLLKKRSARLKNRALKNRMMMMMMMTQPSQRTCSAPAGRWARTA